MSLAYLLLTALCFSVESIDLNVAIDTALARDRIGHAPVKIADDFEFCRRVHLDLVGRIAKPDEIRAFLADPADHRRQLLVDRLLADPAFATTWSQSLHLLLMERMGDHEPWQSYLKDCVVSGKPIRTICLELLNPSAKGVPAGAGFFLSKRLENYGQNPVDYPALTRDIGRLFLGMDLRCAQCHDHLTVPGFKQAHYQGLYAFTRQATLGDAKLATVMEKPIAGKVAFSSVFDMERHETGPALPDRKPLDVAEVKTGDEFAVKPDRKTNNPGIPRVATLPLLANAVADDTRLARTWANRLTRSLLGRGIVEHPDFDHPGNPPSLPVTLDTLANALREGMALKSWLRGMVLSKLYQTASAPTLETNNIPFSRAIERPLSGEVLAKSIEVALGSELGDEARLKRFRQVFGHPAREPEEAGHPSVEKALFWRHDPTVRTLLVAKPGNLMDRLTKLEGAPMVNEVYMSLLGRPANSMEQQAVLDTMAKSQSAAEARRVVVWALLASTEFQINH